MRRLSLVLVAAAFATGAARADAPVVPPDAVAVVGTTPVPVADFDAIVVQARCSYRRQKRTFPPPGSSEWRTLRDQIVAYLVQDVEIAAAAAELGITVDDAQVQARLEALVKQFYNGNWAKYRTALQQQCTTDASVRASIRSQLIMEAVYASVTAAVAVTDDEVAAYYAAHRAQFRKPASRVVRHILVKRKALADELYARLRSGASFAQLARRYSLDPSTRQTGGRLTIARGQTVRGFDRVAFKLRTGAISRPFRTQFGWHIVQALSRIRPGRTLPLAEAAGQIKSLVLAKKKNELMRAWFADVRARFSVTYAPGFEPGAP